ncbi:UbiH/UbiF/VisC/COQ6 family ubiquinone biosynthesis hydroxylase [Marinobacter sp. X15-166B]|uniref:UbiH/UbiF/VisC/COQ6 family ubiquinone biosynthesis hydroxylase n=1 Tax=Marinobacter sp. X15-166B TaxID=1897620 RepID=UPI00085BBE2D|nr:UbiH/UbiF/VisC/COQ6 family ubiquinone biosynthesis hydroxylase [Marinobacter sp. X15-166B]OEY65668.1 2-octaprenyl-3-methyl-6-methoxy-1,4-benzoquinol hydroxylase [Marinobacter sp. X15-166B]
MQSTDHYDILVIGGGMTGTAMALGLADQGWQVALVEAQPLAALMARPKSAGTVDDFEPRVSALSAASQALLQQLGVWTLVQQDRHCNYQGMVVWDAEGTGRVRFDATDLQVPELGTIVENRLLVRALFSRAQDSGLRIIDAATVTRWQETDRTRGVHLADGRKLSATLVIAADGAQSRVRQWVGLPTREWDYGQQAIVCTVRTAHHHEHTAWQSFARTGPLAFLPLQASADDRGRFCSIVWSQDTREAQRLQQLDDAAFVAELAAAIDHQMGAVEAVSKRFGFPLRQRHAKRYIRPGLALVGDAAHSIHPLAGQGANLGYSDVRVLLDELGRARKQRLAPDDPLLLQRYQRRRKADNLTMMLAMEGFKHLFARDELPVRWLRNTGLRWFDRAGILKHRIAAEAMGVHRG